MASGAGGGPRSGADQKNGFKSGRGEMIVTQGLDIEKIRKDFPVLGRQMNGRPLVYLDNAATTQKPLEVIDRLHDFYSTQYGTVHRGVYELSQISTHECDLVREKCRKFLNAK